jgi:hypothetical protein
MVVIRFSVNDICCSLFVFASSINGQRLTVNFFNQQLTTLSTYNFLNQELYHFFSLLFSLDGKKVTKKIKPA